MVERKEKKEAENTIISINPDNQEQSVLVIYKMSRCIMGHIMRALDLRLDLPWPCNQSYWSSNSLSFKLFP